jgi:hypothetical protein
MIHSWTNRFLTWLTVPANFNTVEVSAEPTDAAACFESSVFLFLQLRINAVCGSSEMWRLMRITADILTLLMILKSYCECLSLFKAFLSFD